MKLLTTKKMLVVDCRSYGAAVANRAKGGGCESPGKMFPLSLSYLLLSLIFEDQNLTAMDRKYL